MIDGHNDLPYNIRKFVHNQLSEFNFDVDLKNVPPWSNSNWSHTDLQRMKKGRVAAQVRFSDFHSFSLIFSFRSVLVRFSCVFQTRILSLSNPIMIVHFNPQLKHFHAIYF